MIVLVIGKASQIVVDDNLRHLNPQTVATRHTDQDAAAYARAWSHRNERYTMHIWGDSDRLLSEARPDIVLAFGVDSRTLEMLFKAHARQVKVVFPRTGEPE